MFNCFTQYIVASCIMDNTVTSQVACMGWLLIGHIFCMPKKLHEQFYGNCGCCTSLMSEVVHLGICNYGTHVVYFDCYSETLVLQHPKYQKYKPNVHILEHSPWLVFQYHFFRHNQQN